MQGFVDWIKMIDYNEKALYLQETFVTYWIFSLIKYYLHTSYNTYDKFQSVVAET